MGQLGMLRKSWIALRLSKLRLAPMRRRLGRSLALPAAALVLCLSGCIPGPFLRPDDSTSCSCHSTEPAESNSDSSSDSKEQPPEKNGKPTPRTLGQALGAYWHCLGTHGEALNENKEPAESSKENNSADGKTKNQEKKDTDNADQKESKSDPESAGQEKKDTDNGAQKKENKEESPTSDAKENNGKEDEKKNGKEEVKESWFSGHAQATMVSQYHGAFPSPYIGPHSLLPVERTATSLTATLFLDARLWDTDGWSGELVFNPELAGGQGLSGVQGIAGFPNGEITRVGEPPPTPYFARLFLRQTFGFGGEQEKVEDGPNQIAGSRDVNRFTLSVGKFAATDFADDNRYSHDPRTQFLPWSIMYNGAWDYPANVRGYTYGIGLDFNTKYWALRYGIVAEPLFANAAPLDPKFIKANGQFLEWEQRYGLDDRPGKLRLLAYLNRAHMGDYLESLQQMPVNPDVTQTAAYRYKYGFGLSWEQEVTQQLGVFARLGWNDGHTETWAFTAIDRLAEIGMLLKGKCWCRPDDVLGLAGCINGISGDHRNYLGAGGLDYIIGDGQLRYGPEEIFDVFYSVSITKGIFASFDFQEVNHPAYNRDRGPVAIYTLRVHIEI